MDIHATITHTLYNYNIQIINVHGDSTLCFVLKNTNEQFLNFLIVLLQTKYPSLTTSFLTTPENTYQYFFVN